MKNVLGPPLHEKGERAKQSTVMQNLYNLLRVLFATANPIYDGLPQIRPVCNKEPPATPKPRMNPLFFSDQPSAKFCCFFSSSMSPLHRIRNLNFRNRAQDPVFSWKGEEDERRTKRENRVLVCFKFKGAGISPLREKKKKEEKNKGKGELLSVGH